MANIPLRSALRRRQLRAENASTKVVAVTSQPSPSYSMTLLVQLIRLQRVECCETCSEEVKHIQYASYQCQPTGSRGADRRTYIPSLHGALRPVISVTLHLEEDVTPARKPKVMKIGSPLQHEDGKHVVDRSESRKRAGIEYKQCRVRILFCSMTTSKPINAVCRPLVYEVEQDRIYVAQ